MAKCIRCGGSFLTRSKHQLKDGLICGKCLKELGFDKDINADVSPLQLVRVSDDYVTAKYGEWDLARIKYTNRAKWVKFPTVEAAKEKHGIEKPDDVLRFHQLIIESINHIEKYS